MKNIHERIGLYLTGNKYGLSKLDDYLSQLTTDHLQVNVDTIPLRFESIAKEKPGKFTMLQLHTDMINFLRNEFPIVKSGAVIPVLIGMLQKKVMFYHNAQFEDDKDKNA